MDFAHRQSIFQSKPFAEFQEKIPYRGKTFVLDVGDEQSIIRALIVRVVVKKRWSWLWIPYGPVMKGTVATDALVQRFYRELSAVAQKENALFTCIEPGLHSPPNMLEALRNGAPVVAPTHRFTADHTLVLDLAKTNEELLAEMKPKGRYNIKVADKNGVTVRAYSRVADIPPGDFDAWYALVRETGERDGFGTHGKNYYATLIDSLGKQHGALFLAYSKEKTVIAGSIVTFFDGVGMYFYGASCYVHRALMGPYAVQWAAINEARHRSCTFYDFLGVSPPGDTKHAWHGVTDFKEKFGGTRISYPPAFAIVHRPWLYRFYRWLKK